MASVGKRATSQPRLPAAVDALSRFTVRALLVVLTILAVAGLADFRAAAAADSAKTRGGRVSWARLATPQIQWGRHSNQDPQLASFISAQTSLNIEVWCSVTPEKLDNLCAYPFIFAKDLVKLTDARQIENIGEYLRRGGFFCIDPCVNGYTPADKRNLIER
jgi:hypothetical protein